MSTEIITDYLSTVFYPEKLKRLIPRLVQEILEARKLHAFEAIAFTGMSGAAAAFPVSLVTGIPLICVRKPGQRSHVQLARRGLLGENLEGAIFADSYMILDDQISSGETVDMVMEEIRGYNPRATCSCVMLYAFSRAGEASGGLQKRDVCAFSSKQYQSIPIYFGGLDVAC